MKRKIRLTEGDLHRIVKESVNKILTELDWKTYRNAQEKNKEREGEYENEWWKLNRKVVAAKERGDIETAKRLERKQDALINKSLRTSDFGFASNIAFNDKHFKKSQQRFNDEHGESVAPFHGTDDGSYSTPESWMDDYGNIYNGRYFPGHGKVDGKYYDDIITYETLNNYYGGETVDNNTDGGYTHDELSSMGIPDDEIADIERARGDIRKYRNGGYKYVKGKGWQ